MKNRDIIKAAIVKAQFVPEELLGVSFDKLEITADEYRVQWSLRLAESLTKPLMESSVRGIIFSHEFAKAFWQCEPRMMYMTKSNDVRIAAATIDGGEAWKAHLQILVITPETERLKYIERFL